jgi:hypothetical protein
LVGDGRVSSEFRTVHTNTTPDPGDQPGRIPPVDPFRLDEPRFQLEAAPARLYSLATIAGLFNCTPRKVLAAVRTGLLPQPWFTKGRTQLWAPEKIRPFLDRHRDGQLTL